MFIGTLALLTQFPLSVQVRSTVWRGPRPPPCLYMWGLLFDEAPGLGEHLRGVDVLHSRLGSWPGRLLSPGCLTATEDGRTVRDRHDTIREQGNRRRPKMKVHTVDSRYLQLGYLEFCGTRSVFLNQKYILIAFSNHNLASETFLQVKITRSANYNLNL